MKYKVTCGDLNYKAENKVHVLKIIKTLILPFVDLKVDIKIIKEESEFLNPEMIRARTLLSPTKSSIIDLLKRSQEAHDILTKKPRKKRRIDKK